jgi:uncharacterized protein (TIRG00374 family)
MRPVRRLIALITSLPGRIVISVALMAAVASSIDWDAVADRLSGAAWGWFALGVFLVVLALVVGLARWQALLHHVDLRSPLGSTARAYSIGIFSNNFLPTGFGGDVVRAWLIGRSGRPLARAFTSVGADRTVALVTLFVLGWVGLAFVPVDVPEKLVTPFVIASILGAVVATFAVITLRRRGLSRFLPELLRPWASEVAACLRIYGRSHRLQAEVLALSLVFQALMLCSTYVLARALQLEISPVVLAVVVPLVLLATLMPISVAGFGVREGAYVLLLGELGVSASDATLLSLFTVSALAIASLPGGVAIAVRHEIPPHQLSLPDEAPSGS